MAVSMGYHRHPQGSAFRLVAQRMREAGCNVPVREAEPDDTDIYEDRIDPTELNTVWNRARDVLDLGRGGEIHYPGLREFCDRRGYRSDRPFGNPGNATARWLEPRLRPRWFREGYPLIAPMYSGTGEFMSIHGRAIDGRVKDKTTNPSGSNGRGLLFMSWHILGWLNREAPPPKAILLAEGVTDFWSSAAKRPTIGLVSGSAVALKLLPLTRDTDVFTAMDPDAAGDRYEISIADALAPTVAQRLDIRRIAKAS